jgi:predicted dehydrogenase
MRFITGLEVSEVAADIGHVAPGRVIDDFGGALLRFENGARGSFWVTQAAAGVENSLQIRVSGTRGSLEWRQEFPTQLIFRPLEGPVRIYTPSGPGVLPAAARASRIVAGHPEGFQEAFANVYSDAAEAIAARRSDGHPDPLAMTFPTEVDGAIGVKFVDAVVESSAANGIWTNAELQMEEGADV